MTSAGALIEQFEDPRQRLFSIAYRMLGSTVDAEDAVQDTWLRASKAPSTDVTNVAG